MVNGEEQTDDDLKSHHMYLWLYCFMQEHKAFLHSSSFAAQKPVATADFRRKRSQHNMALWTLLLLEILLSHDLQQPLFQWSQVRLNASPC